MKLTKKKKFDDIQQPVDQHVNEVNVSYVEDEPMDNEEFDDPEEWNDESEQLSSKPEEDYQKEFKVLGEQNFHNLSKINVTSSWVENATQFPAEIIEDNLAELKAITGLPTKLFEKVQSEIQKWFPVQKSVIPTLLDSILSPPVLRPRDVTISAPTGSGKTLCYVLPSLTMIGEFPNEQKLSVLTLVPVQTLVKQIEQEFRRFNVYDAKIVALSGGEDFDKEARKLQGCNVIISTPGRFMEHLMAPDSPIQLNFLRFLIVDEADKMGLKVRMDWLEVIEKQSGGLTRAGNLCEILNSREAPRKILLSATLSKDIEELHMWNLHRPYLFRATVNISEKIHLNHDHITGILALPASIKHELIVAEKGVHPLVLHLRISTSDWKRVLVFVNEKSSAARLSILLSVLAEGKNYKVENLTADLFGRRREKVLKRFKAGTTRVLICSDVLSRGVDVPDIDCVINYDLPANDRLFVHRGGRTGRAGKEGMLLSIGDKESRRRFTTMLKKTGLFNDIKETSISDDDLKTHMEEYQNALIELKKRLSEEKEQNTKKTVSGFEYKRKRKWIPGLKEKREAEKLAKRGIWKNNKKEKDY